MRWDRVAALEGTRRAKGLGVANPGLHLRRFRVKPVVLQSHQTVLQNGSLEWNPALSSKGTAEHSRHMGMTSALPSKGTAEHSRHTGMTSALPSKGTAEHSRHMGMTSALRLAGAQLLGCQVNGDWWSDPHL